jgi:Ca2+-dependent lipid-binding protein
VLFSICYNMSKLTLVVMKCSNLKLMDITRSCDPYVKIHLVGQDGKRLEKRKTEVKRRSPDAVWNETFEFDIPNDKIRDMSLVLTVVDFDRVLPNEAIGQVSVGYRTQGQSLKHWSEMMNHPRKTIAMWHKIKGMN